MKRNISATQPNPRDDFQALLYTGVDNNSDTEASSDFSGDYQTKSKQRMTKLRELVIIRYLLIGIFSLMVLAFIGGAAIGVLLWSNSDPILESIENARLISARVHTIIAPGSQMSSIIDNVGQMSSKLPSVQLFVEAFIRDELTAMIKDVKTGLRLMAKAEGLMDSLPNIDPTDFLAFVETNQLAQRSVRILMAAGNLLNRLEDPTTQESFESMSQEANTLLISMKTIMNAMHQNGLGLTVKI